MNIQEEDENDNLEKGLDTLDKELDNKEEDESNKKEKDEQDKQEKEDSDNQDNKSQTGESKKFISYGLVLMLIGIVLLICTAISSKIFLVSLSSTVQLFGTFDMMMLIIEAGYFIFGIGIIFCILPFILNHRHSG